MSGNHNFTIRQGSEWTRTVTWVGQNLTGFGARMFVKRAKGDVANAIELTTVNGKITIPTPANGACVLRLGATETDVLSGNYVYDLEIYNLTDVNVVTSLIEGKIFIEESVTR